jgi:hypothetical protein
MAWEQATLPITEGGLGIRDPASSWAEARMAALVGLQLRGHCNVRAPLGATQQPSSDLILVINQLQSQLGLKPGSPTLMEIDTIVNGNG